MTRKFALIIGSSEYRDPNLTRLKAPEADVEGLSALLRDPHIGAFDEVVTLANELSATIRRTIAHFFAQNATDDLLLLYFSGHGVLDDRGELFLATRDTERELISGTAIPAAYITGEMDRSRSKRQVLILDCCHSGAFARGTKGIVGASVGTASAFQGTGYGRVVLTATDATQFAWEGDQVIGQAENSLFTHYMIEGLRTGEADTDGDGRISIENLYDYVYDQVVKATPKQTPGKWSYKQQGEIIIANNPRPVTKPAELPRELRDAINSPVAGAREGTVGELERMLNGPHPGFALAALEALKCLANDDSRRVASAATRVLTVYEEAKHLQEQARAEQERLAREKAEQERIAKEKVEAERVAREMAEQERLAREKAEAERIAREKAEAERIARERVEQERIAKEQAEAERLAREKAEADRIAREKAEAEQARIAKEKAEAERVAAQRKAVSSGTRLVVLAAGILVVSLCGLVCIALSLNVLVPKPPTPAPTIPLVAFNPTATSYRVPTTTPAPQIPPTTPAPQIPPTAAPTAAPTQVPTVTAAPAPGQNAVFFRNRGRVYYDKGDFDHALPDYNQALSLDPRDAITYYNRGLLYYDKGDLDRAFADFNQALSFDPKSANAYHGRGNVYYDRGDWDRALADYNQALSLDLKYGYVYNDRGNAYNQKGDYDRAMADYTQALRLDPKFAYAYYSRGLLYRQKGSNAQAIADYEDFVRLAPNAPERATVEQWIQELKR